MKGSARCSARWWGGKARLSVTLVLGVAVLSLSIFCSAKNTLFWESDIDEIDPYLPYALDDNLRYANVTSPVQSILHMYRKFFRSGLPDGFQQHSARELKKVVLTTKRPR